MSGRESPIVRGRVRRNAWSDDRAVTASTRSELRNPPFRRLLRIVCGGIQYEAGCAYTVLWPRLMPASMCGGEQSPDRGGSGEKPTSRSLCFAICLVPSTAPVRGLGISSHAALLHRMRQYGVLAAGFGSGPILWGEKTNVLEFRPHAPQRMWCKAG